MSSKQDYIATAAILAETRTWARDRANTQPTIDHITLALADMFAADSTRFDRERFCAAAGLTP